MKLTGFDIIRFNLKLPKPLAISFHTFEYQENFLLRLYSDSGLVGWGEGAPFKPIIGDSEEEVLAEASQLNAADLGNLTTLPEFYGRILSTISSPTLRAAFDFAAHDLLAKSKGVPVYRLYSETPQPPPNSVTLFLGDNLNEFEADAKRVFALYPHLTVLKIKLNGKDSVERCKRVKAIAPPSLSFTLDANQAFRDPLEAVDVLRSCIQVLGHVLLIEEPCPRDEYEKMRTVTTTLQSAPIFADESCVDEQDLDKLIEAKCVSGINIKLQKCGGIYAGKRLAEKASRAGLTLMVGSMTETPLSISAGVHFAASTKGMVLSDLDMDLDLPRFSTGMTPFENGRRLPIEKPGFDFLPHEARITELKAEGLLQSEVVISKRL